MGDVDCGDCGDCGDCDCDCDCGGCDCDCGCDCGGMCDGCGNFDGCCAGVDNVIFCCFFPGGGSNQNFNFSRTKNRTDQSTPNCTFCCCCFPFDDEESSRKRTTRISSHRRRPSKDGKVKGFFTRLCSCFRKSKHPAASVPTHQHPHSNMGQEPPMKQQIHDGRYPIADQNLNITPHAGGDYGLELDGRWSRPTFYGDYDRHGKT